MSSQYACYRNGKLSLQKQEEIEEYITIIKKNKKKARDIIIVKQYGYLFLDGLDDLERCGSTF
uniref:Uncharacterized protein n=1 Tax=viral metagenome TaxID=1070528 RepID=A0A6C0IZL0_9ZZZZ